MSTGFTRNRQIYRVATDDTGQNWDRYNLLTNALSVDCEDGQNVESKIGNLKGIITSNNDLNNSDSSALQNKAVDVRIFKNTVQARVKDYNIPANQNQNLNFFQFVNDDNTYGYMNRAITTDPNLIYDYFKPFEDNNFTKNGFLGSAYKQVGIVPTALNTNKTAQRKTYDFYDSYDNEYNTSITSSNVVEPTI